HLSPRDLLLAAAPATARALAVGEWAAGVQDRVARADEARPAVLSDLEPLAVVDVAPAGLLRCWPVVLGDVAPHPGFREDAADVPGGRVKAVEGRGGGRQKQNQRHRGENGAPSPHLIGETISLPMRSQSSVQMTA